MSGDRSPTASGPTSASILAFQGGGFRGYFSALVATRIDEDTAGLGRPGPLAHSFDLIAGASVGAIIAAALAAGVAPATVAAEMRAHGEAIFPRRSFLATAPGLLRARFPAGPLRDLLVAILGPRTLGDLDHALLIPAVNESTGEPALFRSYDPRQARLALVDAVLASAAAPTYLPRHRIGDEFFADGGLVANGPALLAARDLAAVFGVPIGRQRIVSIGTTRVPPPPRRRMGRASWGLGAWAFPPPRLLDLLMGGQMDLQAEILRSLDPLALLDFDRTLSVEDARHVHLVLADRRAREVLERAAGDWAASLAAEERARLRTVLEHRGRRLVMEERPGADRPRPRLAVRSHASSPSA